jgi:hypothetical protein
MPIKRVIISDGQDPLTKPALDYLVRLGVPTDHVKRIQLDSPHGDVQTITVTLLVDRDHLAVAQPAWSEGSTLADQ